MSDAVDTLREASREARHNSWNGHNKFHDALADWWRAEAEAHFHGGDDADTAHLIYDMPGMDLTPAVRAARAYLDGES